MMSFRGFSGKFTLVLLLGGFISVGSSSAQDFSSMGISAVVNSADIMLQRGDYQGAIPALKEVIVRTEGLEDASGRGTLQMCRFQLARAYYQVGNVSAGMPVLEAYLDNEPRKEERLALRMMAQGLFEVQDWERITKLAGQLLSLPNLEDEDRYNGNLLLGQAMFQQEQWQESVEPLSYAARKAPNEKISTLCRIMAVRALVESKNWYELFGRIPAIYRTNAKYDISLNLTLMKAGQAQFEEESFLNALLLYRMVLPREALLNFAQKKLDQLVSDQEKGKDGLTEYDKAEHQSEIDSLTESMTSLSELPPYEDEVSFRIGQIYAEVKRYWEGYVLFDQLYQKDKTSDIGEVSMLQSVLILYDIEQAELGEKRILEYLEENPNGQYARTMLTIAIRNYLQNGSYDKIVALQEQVDMQGPTDDPAEKTLQSDLHYMMSFGYFQKKDYARAAEEFSKVVDQYSDTHNAGDAIYYRGMAIMMQGKYADALADFKAYQSQYDASIHFSAAMFREAVCLFGLERVSEAEEVFTRFLNDYPTDVLASEAHSMRGDIEASKEASSEDPHTLDRAVADYRKAIDLANTELQASYSAFQAAKVYQLEFKWQDIIGLMDYYIDRWEEKADVAEAVFWIGRAQIELDQIGEGIDAYMDVIQRFGNEPTLEGIDKIILELVKISTHQLSEEDREDLLVRIKLKLTSTSVDKKVLNLRLRVAQAYLDGEESAKALGVELVNENQDLTVASPLSLALMCDAAVSSGNTDEMGRISTYFMSNYEESTMLWQAYRANAYQELAKENYPGVLAIVDEAQGLFGAESYMGWAQIMKGDMLYAMKDYTEAEAAYNMIMGVPDWRGPLFAEAMYGMGMCRLAAGDYATAHTFFQRTYLLFKSYSDGEWAAKGYLAAAKCLLKLDRSEDARNTLQAMLDDPYTNTSQLADMAREQLKKYGSQ